MTATLVSKTPGTATPTTNRSRNALVKSILAQQQQKRLREHTLREVVAAYINDPRDSTPECKAPKDVLAKDPARVGVLEQWVDFAHDPDTGADMLMKDINADFVRACMAVMRKTPVRRFMGRDEKGEPILKELDKLASESTVQRAKMVLGAVFNYAREDDVALLPASHPSPTREIKTKMVKAEDLPDRSHNDRELAALLAQARVAPWPKLYLFVQLSLTTGGRTSEVRFIRGKDIELAPESGRPRVAIGKTKNGAPKWMLLQPPVIEEIKRFGLPGPEQYLFESRRKPGQPMTVTNAYRRLAAKACLRNRRAYDLRHTAGTILANEGASAQEMQKFMGHKTLAMLPRYSRVHDETLAERLSDSRLARIA